MKENMQLSDLLLVIGGGGVTTIITAIISKVRNKGQRLSDNDTHLQQLSDIMTKTIKNVQEINDGTVNNLRDELNQSRELIKLSHEREDRLIDLVNKGREYQEILELKNKRKSKIIQKAKNCELLKGKSQEECVVLNEYDVYTECKEECKLASKKDS